MPSAFGDRRVVRVQHLDLHAGERLGEEVLGTEVRRNRRAVLDLFGLVPVHQSTSTRTEGALHLGEHRRSLPWSRNWMKPATTRSQASGVHSHSMMSATLKSTAAPRSSANWRAFATPTADTSIAVRCNPYAARNTEFRPSPVSDDQRVGTGRQQVGVPCQKLGWIRAEDVLRPRVALVPHRCARHVRGHRSSIALDPLPSHEGAGQWSWR